MVRGSSTDGKRRCEVPLSRLPFSPAPSLRVPRAAFHGEDLRPPPCVALDRLVRLQCSTNGSLRQCRVRPTGRSLLCSLGQARVLAHRPGFSSPKWYFIPLCNTSRSPTAVPSARAIFKPVVILVSLAY